MVDDNNYGWGEGEVADIRRSLLARQLGFNDLTLPSLPGLTRVDSAVPEAYIPRSDTLGRTALDMGRGTLVGAANALTGTAGLAATGFGYLGNALTGADDITQDNFLTKLGKGTMGLGSSLSEWNRKNNSELTQYYQALDAKKAADFAEKNKAQLNADLAQNGDSFIGSLGAHLSSIGRGAKHGVTNFSDYRSLTSGLGEAAGSLAGVGVTSILGKVGNKVVTNTLRKVGTEEAKGVLASSARSTANAIDRLEGWGNASKIGGL